MKIGVYYPSPLPRSAIIYADNVMAGMEHLGAEFSIFSSDEGLSRDVDVYWDFRCMGGAAPYHELLDAKKPLVVTVHGAAPMAVPAHEYFPSAYHMFKGKLSNIRKKRLWIPFLGRVAAVITVSKFAKREIVKNLNLPESKVVPIYHGVDHEIFRPGGVSDTPHYLLHVSQYQPLKNVDRIIEAYKRIKLENKPSLLLIVPGYKGRQAAEGVEIINTFVDTGRLAAYFSSALCFVFPSLRESFGMPILEAMASGCPVITANNSACSEVAGSAALLVDPRSVDEIEAAMMSVIENDALRSELKELGLKRAMEFNWEICARKHHNLFETVISGSGHALC